MLEVITIVIAACSINSAVSKVPNAKAILSVQRECQKILLDCVDSKRKYKSNAYALRACLTE